jgi:hypothetical protein
MADNKPSLHQRVHDFAVRNVGRQVATGECYDLPHKALTQAGAKSAPDYSTWKSKWAKVDYVWGQPVQLPQACAGDVLQFKDHAMVVTRQKFVRIELPGGGLVEYDDKHEDRLLRGHHSAIVASHNPRDGRLVIYEQHVLRGTTTIQKTVGEAVIYTRDLAMPAQDGTEDIKITPAWGRRVRKSFAPAERQQRQAIDAIVRTFNGRTFQAKVRTTLIVRVSGSVTAYSPEAR